MTYPIAELQIYLDTLLTSERINRAEGSIIRADDQLEAISEVRRAIELLNFIQRGDTGLFVIEEILAVTPLKDGPWVVLFRNGSILEIDNEIAVKILDMIRTKETLTRKA